MTREEAIQVLQTALTSPFIYGEYAEAIDMAIEALTEPKTIIGIDIPYGSDKGIATVFKGKNDKLILEEVKEIMSVVRCKDCRHGQYDATHYFCAEHGHKVYKDDFCSYGERQCNYFGERREE